MYNTLADPGVPLLAQAPYLQHVGNLQRKMKIIKLQGEKFKVVSQL